MNNLITFRPNHKSPFAPSYPFKVMRRKPKPEPEGEYIVYECGGCGQRVAEEYYGTVCRQCRDYDTWIELYVDKKTYDEAGTNEL